MSGVTRTTPQLYRDCLRLVAHIAGKSKKGQQLRRIVGSEFRKHASEEDAEKITLLKSNAVRALANYLMIESSSKDARFKEKANQYSNREANKLKPSNKEEGK